MLAAWLLLMLPGFAQNVGINTDGALPNPNAILDIKSGTKGLLIPRMSTPARLAIPNTKGLLVYDSTTNNFWYNTGNEWQSLATGALNASALAATGPWLLTGNSGTVDTANFLGTTDNVPLNFRVNNTPAGQIEQSAQNTFLGFNSGLASAGGNANTMIGYHEVIHAGGSYNTAIGSESMGHGTRGIFNTAVGQASHFFAGGDFNCALGAAALYSNTSGGWNVAIGDAALLANNSGNFNTAVGYETLEHNFDQTNLTAIGNQSLYSNTEGLLNTAIGSFSLFSNSTGSWNTADGYQALYSNNASRATGIGYQALYSNSTGDGNTATGYQSLFSNTIGNANTADGYFALNGNSTGSEDVASGTRALYANTSGSVDAAFGFNSLSGNTTGASNTAVGGSSMTSNTTGSGNTAIGAFSDVTTTSLSNATAIGFNTFVNASNKVRIGNSAVTVIEGQVPFTTPSDGRYKFNVQENVKGLDFILHLRPVTYQFDVKRFDAQVNHTAVNKGQAENYALQAGYDEATRIRRSGFIAQEVEKAADASGYDFSGIIKPKTEQDHYSLSYDAFVVPLVKAVQEQQKIIREQDRKIEEQQQVNNKQDKEIASLQQQLDEIKKLLQSSGANSLPK